MKFKSKGQECSVPKNLSTQETQSPHPLMTREQKLELKCPAEVRNLKLILKDMGKVTEITEITNKPVIMMPNKILTSQLIKLWIMASILCRAAKLEPLEWVDWTQLETKLQASIISEAHNSDPKAILKSAL